MKIPDSAALVVIDVQQAFLDPRLGERNNPTAEQNIARLLAAWRERGQLIKHVVHDSTEPDSLLRPGQPGNDVQPLAAPLPGEPTYRKHVNSAFIGTTLETDLQSEGVNTLVLVGLTSNHCVSTTARMSANLGFRTYVVADGTAAFERPGLDGRQRPAEDVHSGALSDLQGEFATIVTTAELLKREG
jgi:nicotinamidase-related amidase